MDLTFTPLKIRIKKIIAL